jgi:enoyl-CoA hydratase/carnithine racemase
MKLKTDKMIAEKDGPIGWMIFNNPERRNAVSLAMREAMVTIFEAFGGDDEVRVVVLKGAGDKAFVSGADISEFKERRNSAEAEALYAAAADRSRRAMEAFDKPIIAMIHGFCVGGGLATAIACDLRIASDSSQFGIPAAKLGLGYAYSSLKQLTDVVGPAAAKEILFTGRRFNAEKALRMGLVNEVVAAGRLEATVRDYADEIAANAPLTVKAAKATIGEIFKRDQDKDLGAIEAMVKRCFDSEDYREGREAFMAKRRPVFVGR